MILNNKGWGLGEMLILIGVLLFGLLVSTILYNYYKHDVKNNNESFSTNNTNKNISKYEMLEDSLINAAKIYNKDDAVSSNDQQIIQKKELQSYNLIDEIYDVEDGTICDGYVLVLNNDYQSYINCTNYTTVNYSSSYVEQ